MPTPARQRGAALATAALITVASVLFLGETAARADPPAGTVHISGTTLRFEPGPGVANNVDVSPLAGEGLYRIVDHAAALLPGAGCVQDGDHADTVLCDDSGLLSFAAALGDENDILGVRGTLGVIVDGAGGADHIEGGNGIDTLHGGGGADTLMGWAGGDWLYGGDGDDELVGGSGNDVFIGGPGADTTDGGTGADTASYDRHHFAVTADPDGQPGDDGAPGEGDTIRRDVENLVGSPRDDHLTGGPGPNVLTGGGGDDVLVGGGGDDMLVGGPGDDRLHGGNDFDAIFGDDVPSPGGPSPAAGWDVCAVGPGGGTTIGCESIA